MKTRDGRYAFGEKGESRGGRSKQEQVFRNHWNWLETSLEHFRNINRNISETSLEHHRKQKSVIYVGLTNEMRWPKWFRCTIEAAFQRASTLQPPTFRGLTPAPVQHSRSINQAGFQAKTSWWCWLPLCDAIVLCRKAPRRVWLYFCFSWNGRPIKLRLQSTRQQQIAIK